MILDITSVAERSPSSLGVLLSNIIERLFKVTGRKNREVAAEEVRRESETCVVSGERGRGIVAVDRRRLQKDRDFQ